MYVMLSLHVSGRGDCKNKFLRKFANLMQLGIFVISEVVIYFCKLNLVSQTFLPPYFYIPFLHELNKCKQRKAIINVLIHFGDVSFIYFIVDKICFIISAIGRLVPVSFPDDSCFTFVQFQ